MDSANIISYYFPEIPDDQLDLLKKMEDLFKYWNQKINVISRKDISQLNERHTLHSLSINKFISLKKGSKVLDIGTGGGFPGIPLAITNPEVDFHLIDSIGKKVKVVAEIVKDTGLQNVTFEQCRAEAHYSSYDFVVSRAVAPLNILVKWAKKNVANNSKHSIKNGFICLKGGNVEQEVKQAKVEAEVKELSLWFSEPFFETKKLIHIGI